MHSTLKRICVTEGLLKVPSIIWDRLSYSGSLGGAGADTGRRRSTPLISHQFHSKYGQRFIVKIVGKKALKKYLVCVWKSRYPGFQKEGESPFKAWSLFAHWGFTRFFLCLGETRLPTCLSLVTGLPKLPLVRLKISTHAQRMPHQCFV